MKLSQKLTSAFVALMALTLVIGALGMYNMGRINASTEEIATSWLPSVRTLGNMRAAANQIRRAESDHLLSANDAERSAAEARIAETRNLLARYETAYGPLITSSRERALYDDYVAARDRYFGVQERLLRSSRGGSAEAEAARTLFRGESRASFNALVERIASSWISTTKDRARPLVAPPRPTTPASGC